MREATAGELKALTVFFQSAAPQYAFYDFKTKKLKENARGHGLYKKNLEILLDLVDRKGVDLRTFEGQCRICRREGRRVQWVNEVIPSALIEGDVMQRNLIQNCHIHRLLVSITPVLTSLPIGAAAGILESPGEVKVRDLFTMSELIEHFCAAFDIERTAEVDKSFAGAFNFLLTYNPLDAILFAIDYAQFDNQALRSPLDLKDNYIPQALEEIRLRKARV